MGDKEPSRATLHFHCDAMLGGLARWLRAVGYDAIFEHGIDDGDLVACAAASGAVVLSSDRPLFDRKPLRSGAVRGLFVPRHAPVLEQTVFVLRALDLDVRGVRCMACGGELAVATREQVGSEVPAAVLAAYEDFWRCERCRRVYWQGTHWTRITAARDEVARRLLAGHVAPAVTDSEHASRTALADFTARSGSERPPPSNRAQ